MKGGIEDKRRAGKGVKETKYRIVSKKVGDRREERQDRVCGA